MLKKFFVGAVILGIGCIGFWGGVQLFGDSIVSEIKKGESVVIQTPAKVSTEPGAETAPPEEVRQYTIKISNRGGDKEMDYCASGFTDMIHYKGLDDHQLLAQHNKCGGDIILPMELGDHVVIEGDQEYVITELRDTSKTITTAAINDMDGDVLLQTCYWRENRMKFVALTPADEVYNQQ